MMKDINGVRKDLVNCMYGSRTRARGSLDDDLSDLGNEIGVIIGKYIDYIRDGWDWQDFINGVKHGISLITGEHDDLSGKHLKELKDEFPDLDIEFVTTMIVQVKDNKGTIITGRPLMINGTGYGGTIIPLSWYGVDAEWVKGNNRKWIHAYLDENYKEPWEKTKYQDYFLGILRKKYKSKELDVVEDDKLAIAGQPQADMLIPRELKTFEFHDQTVDYFINEIGKRI